jgi:hypothetical protein
MRGQGNAFLLLRAKDRGIIAYWYRMSMITCKWFGCCGIAWCLFRGRPKSTIEPGPGKTVGKCSSRPSTSKAPPFAPRERWATQILSNAIGLGHRPNCSCAFLFPTACSHSGAPDYSLRAAHMRTRTLFGGILLLLVICFLAGCTAGPNHFKDVPDADGSLAGFWLGLWHGMISPLTFIVSLFSEKVSIYEVHNNGGLYNFGFLLGIAMVWGGGGAAARD